MMINIIKTIKTLRLGNYLQKITKDKTGCGHGWDNQKNLPEEVTLRPEK